MTHFTFSIHQSKLNACNANFQIKVNNENASFIIKNNIHFSGSPYGEYTYNYCVDDWEPMDICYTERIAEKQFDKIISDEYLSSNNISGSICDIEYNVNKNTIVFDTFTVPAHKLTRKSLVELFKFINKQFDEIDSYNMSELLHEYISKIYTRKCDPINTDKNTSNNLNEYFRSGKGTEEFRGEYVKMLLEYGSI